MLIVAQRFADVLQQRQRRVAALIVQVAHRIEELPARVRQRIGADQCLAQRAADCGHVRRQLAQFGNGHRLLDVGDRIANVGHQACLIVL